MTDVPIQIINGTNGVTIQTEDPIISIITIIATLALAAVAIISLIMSKQQTEISNRLTRESNDLLRAELTARLAPMPSFTGMNNKIIEKDGRCYLEIKTMISNSGKIPMRNVRIRAGLVEAIFIEQIIKAENELKHQNELLSTLLPDQSTSDLHLQFSFEDEIEKSSGTIVLWLDYKYLDFAEVIQVLRYDEGTKIARVGEFYSYHDILDARKKIEAESNSKSY